MPRATSTRCRDSPLHMLALLIFLAAAATVSAQRTVINVIAITEHCDCEECDEDSDVECLPDISLRANGVLFDCPDNMRECLWEDAPFDGEDTLVFEVFERNDRGERELVGISAEGDCRIDDECEASEEPEVTLEIIAVLEPASPAPTQLPPEEMTDAMAPVPTMVPMAVVAIGEAENEALQQTFFEQDVVLGSIVLPTGVLVVIGGGILLLLLCCCGCVCFTRRRRAKRRAKTVEQNRLTDLKLASLSSMNDYNANEEVNRELITAKSVPSDSSGDDDRSTENMYGRKCAEIAARDRDLESGEKQKYDGPVPPPNPIFIQNSMRSLDITHRSNMSIEEQLRSSTYRSQDTIRSQQQPAIAPQLAYVSNKKSQSPVASPPDSPRSSSPPAIPTPFVAAALAQQNTLRKGQHTQAQGARRASVSRGKTQISERGPLRLASSSRPSSPRSSISKNSLGGSNVSKERAIFKNPNAQSASRGSQPFHTQNSQQQQTSMQKKRRYDTMPSPKATRPTTWKRSPLLPNDTSPPAPLAPVPSHLPEVIPEPVTPLVPPPKWVMALPTATTTQNKPFVKSQSARNMNSSANSNSPPPMAPARAPMKSSASQRSIAPRAPTRMPIVAAPKRQSAPTSFKSQPPPQNKQLDVRRLKPDSQSSTPTNDEFGAMSGLRVSSGALAPPPTEVPMPMAPAPTRTRSIDTMSSTSTESGSTPRSQFERQRGGANGGGGGANGHLAATSRFQQRNPPPLVPPTPPLEATQASPRASAPAAQTGMFGALSLQQAPPPRLPRRVSSPALSQGGLAVPRPLSRRPMSIDKSRSSRSRSPQPRLGDRNMSASAATSRAGSGMLSALSSQSGSPPPRAPASPRSSTKRAPASPRNSTKRAPASPRSSRTRAPASPRSSRTRAPASPRSSRTRAPASPRNSTRRAPASPRNSTKTNLEALRKSPQPSIADGMYGALITMPASPEISPAISPASSPRSSGGVAKNANGRTSNSGSATAPPAVPPKSMRRTFRMPRSPRGSSKKKKRAQADAVRLALSGQRMELSALETIWKRNVVNENSVRATESQARAMAHEVLATTKERSVRFLPTFRSVDLPAVMEYFDNRAAAEIEDMIEKLCKENAISHSNGEATFAFSSFGNAVFKTMLPKVEAGVAAVVVRTED